MTRVSHRSTCPQRRGLQFSLLALIAVVAAAAVLSRWWLYEPAPRTRIDLHVDPKGVLVDSRGTSRSHLSDVLQGRRRGLEEAGLVEEGATVRITVDDEATYGQLERVVMECWYCGLYQVELKTGADTECFEVSRNDSITEISLLPKPIFVVRLVADQNGELVCLSVETWDTAVSNASFDRLGREVLAFVGTERGGYPLRELVTVELECNDHLKFKHVKAALDAMTERPDASGPRVPILRRIWLRVLNAERARTITGSREDLKPRVFPVVPQVETPTIGELKIPTPSADPE